MASVARHNIWWTNAVFFVSVHVATIIGVYYWPLGVVSGYSMILAFFMWQLPVFGITVGYHRLYSHRAFRASLSVRIVLAIFGSAGFQGSIKWWCLRHRLHHRFTDDPIQDPYAATRGLLFSHMGWIFFKPVYDKMPLIDRDDLERDPVARFQHRFYVPIALFCGFMLPTILGCIWKDPIEAFVWGGLVSKIAIWHCTFLVNSLAHWDGLQPYSDENTSRGNLIVALLTGGEGNHNFHHAFPHDFRSGPSPLDWDPSKWIILSLHRLGLVYGLRQARQDDVHEARAYMLQKSEHGQSSLLPEDHSMESWDGETWSILNLEKYLSTNAGSCLLVIDDFIVDATAYLKDHPGGSTLLRKYSVSPMNIHDKSQWGAADWAFQGGLNYHSRSARRLMGQLRIAKLD